MTGASTSSSMLAPFAAGHPSRDAIGRRQRSGGQAWEAEAAEAMWLAPEAGLAGSAQRLLARK